VVREARRVVDIEGYQAWLWCDVHAGRPCKWTVKMLEVRECRSLERRSREKTTREEELEVK